MNASPKAPAFEEPEALIDHIVSRYHDVHRVQLDRLMHLTHNATPPQGACYTWRALCAGVAAFREDLTAHFDGQGRATVA